MNDLKNNPMDAIMHSLADAQYERCRIKRELASLNTNMERLRHAPLRHLDRLGEVASPAHKENENDHQEIQ